MVIGQAITLGRLDRYEAALAVAGRARDLARQVGTTLRLGRHAEAVRLAVETGDRDTARAFAERTDRPRQ